MRPLHQRCILEESARRLFVHQSLRLSLAHFEDLDDALQLSSSRFDLPAFPLVNRER